MPSALQQVGTQGEKLACDYLLKKGYQLLDHQWHCRCGELDLVMKDAEELVFVEVKMRANDHYGHPEEMVSARKIQRLKKAAWEYLQRHDQLDSFWRFDIIAITGDTQKHELYHIQDALRND